MLRKLDLLAKIGRRGKVMKNKKMKEKGLLGVTYFVFQYGRIIRLVYFQASVGCMDIGDTCCCCILGWNGFWNDGSAFAMIAICDELWWIEYVVYILFSQRRAEFEQLIRFIVIIVIKPSRLVVSPGTQRLSIILMKKLGVRPVVVSLKKVHMEQHARITPS
jgi:hypothetical protein